MIVHDNRLALCASGLGLNVLISVHFILNNSDLIKQVYPLADAYGEVKPTGISCGSTKDSSRACDCDVL